MQRIWISIGSNLDPETNVPAALEEMGTIFGEASLSPLYRTPSIGFEGPPFVNMVAGYITELSPEEALDELSAIEKRLGRVRGPKKYDSRTIDLDLLTYGDQVLDIGRKRLPRNEILEYAFVLRPLADVAPDEIHPLDGRTYAQLWSDFDGQHSRMDEINSPGWLERTGIEPRSEETL